MRSSSSDSSSSLSFAPINLCNRHIVVTWQGWQWLSQVPPRSALSTDGLEPWRRRLMPSMIVWTWSEDSDKKHLVDRMRTLRLNTTTTINNKIRKTFTTTKCRNNNTQCVTVVRRKVITTSSSSSSYCPSSPPPLPPRRPPLLPVRHSFLQTDIHSIPMLSH